MKKVKVVEKKKKDNEMKEQMFEINKKRVSDAYNDKKDRIMNRMS